MTRRRRMIDIYKVEPYSTDEITSIFKAVKNSEYLVPVVISLFTGMRESEILSLRWSDISFDQNTISITKQLSRYTGEIEAPKSASTLQISPHLKAFLAKVKESQQSLQDFVCIHEDGSTLTFDNLKQLSKAIAEHGIKFNFRNLRHTHILTLKEEVMQKRLGAILQTL
ncbi:tyrosine-type recombinase/integrase [Phascolarctobacterium sp.]|uniref:tyrosine-type recombinase/integrase n=1 Tax=Phascolarctobacterium sp. TaxID=2049039 RepID=UPI0038708FC6